MRQRRSPVAIIRDVLTSFRGEKIPRATLQCRCGVDGTVYKKYISPLIDEGFIRLEIIGKRKYPIRYHSLTYEGQKLLLALGGKP